MNISINKEYDEKRYPGKRSVTICLKGCNLKCAYCFSSKLTGAARVDLGEFEAVYAYLKENRNHIDGVVVTGGEPTLHADLPQWLAAFKDLGLSIKLETNGTNPEVLRLLLNENLINFLSMDVKATPENYATVCGGSVDTSAIKNSIWIIKSSAIEYEFTTTLVPGFHTIRELKKIAGMVNGAKRFVVRDFVSKNALRPELRGRAAFPHKPIESVRHIIERKVEEFIIESNDAAFKMYIPGRRKRRRCGSQEAAVV